MHFKLKLLEIIIEVIDDRKNKWRFILDLYTNDDNIK